MYFAARPLTLTPLGCLVLATLARAASAPDHQTTGDSPGALIDLGGPRREPTALDSIPHPWPGIALSLSVVGTVTPIALMGLASRANSDGSAVVWLLVAEIATPSAGHLYAGLYSRAAVGMVTRTLGFGALGLGAAAISMGDQSTTHLTGSTFLVLLGGGVMAGSAIVDIVTVPGDVDKRNAKWLSSHASVGLRMSPDATPELAVAVRF